MILEDRLPKATARLFPLGMRLNQIATHYCVVPYTHMDEVPTRTASGRRLDDEGVFDLLI